MYLLLAKSTFDHPDDGCTVTPGQPLEVGEALAATLTNNMLAEAPRAGFHHQVEEGPNGRSIYHKGGGHYLVLDENGRILNEEALQGREAAVDYAADTDAN